LSVPASAPRTECFCQLVAPAISSIVAPLGRRSRFNIVSSLEMPATLLLLPVFPALRGMFLLEGALLMSVPFNGRCHCGAATGTSPRRGREQTMLESTALSTEKRHTALLFLHVRAMFRN